MNSVNGEVLFNCKTEVKNQHLQNSSSKEKGDPGPEKLEFSEAVSSSDIIESRMQDLTLNP